MNYDILEEIKKSQSTKEIWGILAQNMMRWGVPYVASWVGSVPGNAQIETNRPEWWMQYYLEQHHPINDPAIQHCLYNKGFFFYSTTDDQPSHIPPEGARILSEAKDLLGFNSGLVFPVFCNENRLGGMSISFDTPLQDLEKMPIKNFSEMLVCCNMAFERFTQIHSKSITPKGGLVSREIDCLSWLSRGLRTADISKKLHISDATVCFHLNNAKKKLGATTREQAVARAIVLQIITPN